MKKLKRILAIILSLSLLMAGCESNSISVNNIKPEESISDSDTSGDSEPEPTNITNSLEENGQYQNVVDNLQIDIYDTDVPDFYGLDDEKLIQYLEDKVYSQLESDLISDDYIVEDVHAIYISKTYLEELEYNSKSNIYFGYTLAEIEDQFEGTKYIFTLGEDGTTVVQPFEDYDDTFDRVIKNVAIGTGVILLCVTVSVVASTVGAPVAVSIIFAESAAKGAEIAISSSLISAASTAIITGYETGDPEAALKNALLEGSESFKIGAISGCIAGGIDGAIKVRQLSETGSGLIPSPREAEIRAEEFFGGETQVTYLEGTKVPYGTPGGTRPDIVRSVGGRLEAIEVKRYDLENNYNELVRILRKQISDRAMYMPEGSTQRICLNVEGRGYSKAFVDGIVNQLQGDLSSVYPNIPITVMGV